MKIGNVNVSNKQIAFALLGATVAAIGSFLGLEAFFNYYTTADAKFWPEVEFTLVLLSAMAGGGCTLVESIHSQVGYHTAFFWGILASVTVTAITCGMGFLFLSPL